MMLIQGFHCINQDTMHNQVFSVDHREVFLVQTHRCLLVYILALIVSWRHRCAVTEQGIGKEIAVSNNVY